MNLIHGFIQTQAFYDDIHFPRGFNRSGKFSIQESDLLTKIGKRLSDLELGKAQAENQIEENFVRMCLEGAEAETQIEKLWHKYKDSIKVKSFHTLNGSAKVVSLESESKDEIDV